MNISYFKKSNKQNHSQLIHDLRTKFGGKWVVLQKCNAYNSIDTFRVLIVEDKDFHIVKDANFYDIGDFFNGTCIFLQAAAEITDDDLNIELKAPNGMTRTFRTILYKAMMSKEIESSRYGYAKLHHAIWLAYKK